MTDYIPSGDAWETLDPSAAGFDPALLDEAIAFHRANETAWPRSMYLPDGQYIGTATIGDRPEHAAVIGPVTPRGAPNGLILRGGRIVAEWGDTRRTDMTFSIAKSYLAVLAGLAVQDGLIPDLDQPVAHAVPGPWFEGPHNSAITWRNLLQQTSEWSGTLWGKPDAADHNRVVGPARDGGQAKGEARALAKPGAHYEYNDVRVNLLAACLTTLFRRPLPDVLKQRIMDPAGASQDWSWHGYENSFVEIGGERIRSVSGGGHWGGGMVIGSRDHARLGLLVSRGGRWGGQELISPDWVRQMLTPSPCFDQYGFLWWLRGAQPAFPAATPDSVFARGAGVSILWIAPSLDLVAVFRWIDGAQVNGFIGKVLASLRR